MAEENQNTNEGILTSAARGVGTAIGKVAKLAGGAVKAPAGAHAQSTKIKTPEGLYQAEYLGSGTFAIRKPKRESAKLRQSRLKGARRGARK